MDLTYLTMFYVTSLYKETSEKLVKCVKSVKLGYEAEL